MNPLHTSDQDGARGEWVSALCDDALSGQELDLLLASQDRTADLHATWHGYQVIGDVLRGRYAGPAARPPAEFLQALHARLAEPSAAIAQPAAALPPRGAAANDAVFRWKLVSGFASVVAVVAIGWNLLAVSPQADPAAPLLAQPSPAPAAPALVSAQAGAERASAAPRTVVVATPQGRVIRDASLERLMAEHRQHGGMSAFQTSTGFIRNATYDADAR